MENIENTIACCRCGEVGEMIEREPEGTDKSKSLVELSLNEQSFIRSKFKGPLCIPCLSQLKTSFRIINGDYNIASGENVSL